MFKKIIVTGANGQLASCIKHLADQYPQFEFVFLNKNQLDITHEEAVMNFFSQHSFTHLINTAAYTQVDRAEEDDKTAFEVNEQAVKNLALACEKHGVELLHISTDYVFDGKANHPYLETDLTSPINVYGASKLAGEKVIAASCKKHLIIRSSWLYSPFGHNFYLSIKTALKNQKTMQITTEQVGTPTSAFSLVEALMKIIAQDKKEYGVYHFSDLGQATWYDFAMQIERKVLGENKGYIQATDFYKTLAKRPAYSVLSNDKIQHVFNITSIPWQLALDEI